jgi:hypothetical protein
LHEDEVPATLPNGTSTANKMTVVYQMEPSLPALGNGAIHVWDEMSVLVDVQVPGTSQEPGRTLMRDIFTALHQTSGTNAHGTVTSCVFAGVLPGPPERIEATGEEYEHLRLRFELKARGT